MQSAYVLIPVFLILGLGIFLTASAQQTVITQAELPFRFGTPINLAMVNSSHHDSSPDIFNDGLSLFFGSERPGGMGKSDLWVTTRSTQETAWSNPENLGPSVNSSYVDYYPCVSYDGLTLYFYSTRPGGAGGGDIWVATRANTTDPWGEAVNLESVNSSADEAAPSISSDGLSLFFRSTRSGGFGQADIWMTTRAKKEDVWSTPVNLGSTINTSAWDCGVNLSSDGLALFFHSNRPGGFGNFDLYVSIRETQESDWSAPVNLGENINTPNNEFCPNISADGKWLYFSDDPFGGPLRPGGLGGGDLWQASIEHSAPSVVMPWNQYE